MIPQDGDPLTVEEDIPEGTAPLRKVRFSETLFRQLGVSYISWGKPDAEGFYEPALGIITPPVASRGLQRWVIVAVFLLGLIVGAGLALAWPSRAGATSPSVWVGVPSFVPVPRSAQATSTAVPAWVPAASGTPELSRTPVPSASPSPTRTRPAATVKSPTAQPSVAPRARTRLAGWATFFDVGGGLYGAVHSYSWGEPRYYVTVCAVQGSPRCIDVRIISYCACGMRHGTPTVIDLSPEAFAYLAGPKWRSLGVMRVMVLGAKK